MTQTEALNILKTGANVFLTGEPGAGKTHTINEYVRYLRAHDIEPAITASTGIAATHIGGMTIHSWSGIGIRETLTRYDLDKIGTSEYLHRRIKKTKVLIIDEVSMLSSNTLSMVDAVCREIKQNPEPFGGLQVVLVGDFFQLPPVQRYIPENEKQSKLIKENKSTTNFAFDSEAWKKLAPVVCYITEQHRQEDDDFLGLLNAIRRGTLEDDHYEYMKTRYIKREEIPENITKLFSHNLNVDTVNDGELSKIEEEKREYTMNSSGSAALVTTLKKGCLSPEVLSLKKGAIVMCTKNNPKEHFVNGTLGTVVEFDEFSGNPIIRTKAGRNIEIAPMDWCVEENGKIKAMIVQVPLRLAWAITVHKSQGMSMDAAVMDLSGVFEYGQGYVALSRVRRMSGLFLLGMNNKALQVHPQILEQDNIFRDSSEQAQKTFANLDGAELKKMHRNFVLALGGKWREEKESKTEGLPPPSKDRNFLEKAREKSPQAYRKWSKEDEEKLSENFKNGKSIKELCALFGRQTGGIKSRLVKLGLIEDDYKKQ